ncbi:DNA gyrase inhibitor YacG [Jiella avicenniae]|uniref:DNA gyrase inhibitor YacG n=1 Tax=Jiella avicenniae TaxID=2907202 RepID=A0A9X1P4P1_9HYPH|nr:DNA gyrase inhibitor YacG [Jiella avicenniae]MCE7029211.1 DNA gyrase inhibitor YacG [Jiella avicenniae]
MTSEATPPTPMRPTRKCPECGRPSRRETFPFCSPRCQAVDLNRWLSGRYVIPGPPLDEASEDGER